MSVPCSCPLCGGNDSFAMCENGVLEAFAKTGSPSYKIQTLALTVLVTLFILAIALASCTDNSSSF